LTRESERDFELIQNSSILISVIRNLAVKNPHFFLKNRAHKKRTLRPYHFFKNRYNFMVFHYRQNGRFEIDFEKKDLLVNLMRAYDVITGKIIGFGDD